MSLSAKKFIDKDTKQMLPIPLKLLNQLDSPEKSTKLSKSKLGATNSAKRSKQSILPTSGSKDKIVLPVPKKVLDQMDLEEEKASRPVKRRLIQDPTPSSSKKYDMKPLSVKKEYPTYNTRMSTLPSSTKKQPTRQSVYHQSTTSTKLPLLRRQTNVIPTSKVKNVEIKNETAKKVPALAQTAKKVPAQTLPNSYVEKLKALQNYINFASAIVNELLESSQMDSEKLIAIESNLSVTTNQLNNENVKNDAKVEDKSANKENITVAVERKLSANKEKGTPKRRSLRLMSKLKRSVSEGNLKSGDNSSHESGSDTDSFLRMEQDLNIVHKKKTLLRKTIGTQSIRERAILQAAAANNSVLNTPQTINKLKRSKSVLNTPRTTNSKVAMKQLQRLLSEETP